MKKLGIRKEESPSSRTYLVINIIRIRVFVRRGNLPNMMSIHSAGTCTAIPEERGSTVTQSFR
jgi:hypothetical protein